MYLLLLVGIISLAALLSIRLLKAQLHPIEILSYWVFIASIEQLSFIIVAFNLKKVQLVTNHLDFWTLKMSSLFIIPILFLWYLACMHRTGFSVALKLLLTAGFILIFTLIDYVYWSVKLLVFVHWTLWQSSLLYLLIMYAALCFSALYRLLMKKEGILT